MKRLILAIFLNVLSIQVSMASNDIDRDLWIDDMKDTVFIKHGQFFNNLESQPIEAFQETLVDFLDLCYQRREGMFVGMFRKLPAVKIPQGLLTREWTLGLAFPDGKSIPQLFDMRHPQRVKGELKTLCQEHQINRAELLVILQGAFNALYTVTILKQELDKTQPDIMAAEGEREDIGATLVALNPLVVKANDSLIAYVDRTLRQHLRSVFVSNLPCPVRNGGVLRIESTIDCGYENAGRAGIVSALDGVDWQRYMYLFKFILGYQEVCSAYAIDELFRSKFDIKVFKQDHDWRILSKFKAMEVSSPPPVLVKAVWESWVNGLFANYHTLSGGEAITHFLAVSKRLFEKREELFRRFMLDKGIVDQAEIPDELFRRDISYSTYNGRVFVRSVMTRVGGSKDILCPVEPRQEAMDNQYLIQALEKDKVDAYDLLSGIRDCITTATVEEFLLEKFDLFSAFQLEGNSTADKLLTLWKSKQDEEKTAYDDLRKLFAKTQKKMNEPWMREIPVPSKRGKKRFTTMEFRFISGFDDLTCLESVSRNRQQADKFQKWNLLMATYLYCRSRALIEIAANLSTIFDVPKPRFVVVNRSTDSGKVFDRKANMLLRLASARAGNSGSSAVAPASESKAMAGPARSQPVKGKPAAPQDAQVPEAFRIGPEAAVAPKPAPAAEPAPQPLATQPVYTIQDLPMAEEILPEFMNRPADKPLTNEELVKQVADLIQYFAKYRKAEADALLKRVGIPVTFDSDSEYFVSIFERGDRVYAAGEGSFVVPLNFTASNSSLHEELVEWSKGSETRMHALLKSRKDLIIRIYLSQLSLILLKHVGKLDASCFKSPSDNISDDELAGELLRISGLSTHLWTCYRGILTQYLEGPGNIGGFRVDGPVADFLDISVFIPGLDRDESAVKVKFSDKVYFKYASLLEKLIQTLCSPAFPAHFNPASEARMLTFSNKEMSPVYLSYSTAREIYQEREDEVNLVKEFAKKNLGLYITEKKQNDALLGDAQKSRELLAETTRLMTQNQAKADAEIAQLKSQLAALQKKHDDAVAQKGELTKKVKAAEKAKSANDKALAEKDARLAQLEGELRGAAEVGQTQKASIAQQQRTLEELRPEIDRLKQSSSKLEVESKETKRLLDAEKAEHQRTKSSFGQQQSALDKLRLEVQSLKQAYSSLEAGSRETARLLEIEISDHTQVKTALVDIWEQKQQQQKIIAKDDATIARLNKELEGAVDKMLEMERESESLQKELVRVQEELKEIAGLAMKKSEESESLKQQLTTAQQEASNARDLATRVEALERVNAEIRQVNLQFYHGCEGLKQQCQALYDAKMAAEAKLAEAQAVPAQAPAAVAPSNDQTLSDKITKLKAKIAAQIETIENLNAMISEMKKAKK